MSDDTSKIGMTPEKEAKKAERKAARAAMTPEQLAERKAAKVKMTPEQRAARKAKKAARAT